MKVIEQRDPIRDHRGNPIIGGIKCNRASTDVVSDKSNLIPWKAKDTFERLKENPSLLELPTEEVLAMLDQSRQAAAGTARHEAMHHIALHGCPPDECPEDVAADAYAALEAIHDAGYTPVCGEVFVVCFDLLVAGSFDMLVVADDGTAAILDLKTSTKPGKERYSSLAWAQQLSVYANGKPIDADGEVVDWADLDLPAPNLDFGIVVQVVQGSGRADLGFVDLRYGFQYARLGYEVRQARKDRSLFTRRVEAHRPAPEVTA